LAKSTHQRVAGLAGVVGVVGVAGRAPGLGVVGVVVWTVSGMVRSMLTSTWRRSSHETFTSIC